MARVQYVVAGIVGICLIMLPVFFLLAVGTGFGASVSGGIFTSVTFAITFLMFVAMYMYVAVVTMSKRLHDLGLSGWHSAWIIAVWIFSNGTSETNPGVVAIMLSMVSLLVGLWLIFAPGQPHANRFGPVPA